MCDCIERINGLLKDFNTELNVAIFFDGLASRPILGVMKLDKKIKGKPQDILAKFCPFCGTAYPGKESAQHSVQADTEKLADHLCEGCSGIPCLPCR